MRNEYEFECKDCKTKFSIILDHFYSEKDMPNFCPNCSSIKIIKRVSHLNFILKGEGWNKRND